MKPTRLNNISGLLLLSLFLFSACGRHCDSRDRFYFTPEDLKYQPDTTGYPFKMVDNHGITEEFYVDRTNFYPDHHYFSILGNECDPVSETFGIAYHSTVNDYFISMVMRAGIPSASLEIDWNLRNWFTYDFGTAKVIDGIAPEIYFYDSLTVRGKTYYKIIEIDYTGKINQIDANTPVKTYISGNEGLIKFIRKDNITLERIE